MSLAFLFPGQGSQAVGMGKALAENFPQAKAVFDEVDDALSQKLGPTMAHADFAHAFKQVADGKYEIAQKPLKKAYDDIPADAGGESDTARCHLA